jgi:uncharacterized protein YndB with AHSA1/START domain
MRPIKASIEIERSTADVFSYTADPARRREWQNTVRVIDVQSRGSLGTGTRVRETRAVTGGDRTFEWEYKQFTAPSAWAFRGLGGPVRPVGQMTFAELAGSSATRVEMEIDFEADGIARVLAMLARRDARKQIPRELSALKQRLEAATPA